MGNGSFIPNTTQVANNVLDILLPFLREGERAVLLYIVRRTFGFGREEDSISLDQFEHGLMTNTGKRLDYGCGMKRRVIIQALSFLMESGLIERLEGGLGRTHISRYHLCIKDCPVIHQLEDMQDRNATPEEIVHYLHLFRKGADNAPKHDLSVDISNVYDKGAENAPLENSAESALNTAIKGADNDTKKVQKSNPQNNRERKKETDPPIVPQSTGVISDRSPVDDRVNMHRATRSYEDAPGFCELWDMAVIRPNGSKGIKAEAFKRWNRLKPNPETHPSLLEQILTAYAYQKTTREWQNKDGQYVSQLQVWIGSKGWEGVTVPSGFDRHVQARATTHTPRRYRDGDLTDDGTMFSPVAT